MHQITLIPGDGVGPEVMAAARRVMDASGAAIEWEVVNAGATYADKLPKIALESIRRNHVALKGPTETPRDPVRIDNRAHPGVTIALRKELDLYAAVRPVRSIPGVASRYEGVDFVIYRENTEDLYAGLDRMVDANTAQADKIITRGATQRMARFALDHLQAAGRTRLTIGHKANILKATDGLFLRAALEVAQGYPGLIVEDRIVDALCMELVMKPQSFDAILLPNLYGDIVSDIGAGLVGGLGVAGSGNFGDDCAMFEPVHGSAPDIAGRNLANPMAAIVAGQMLLHHVGESAAAQRIERALTTVMKTRKALTRDLGGTAGTREMTDAIVDCL